jgi:hypothetical protein
MIFKKTKKPYIKFVSEIEGLDKIDECVPKLATKYIPQWFKNVPANLDPAETRTVKTCPSFSDFFSSAYVVPAWEDSILKYNKETNEWKTVSSGLTKWEIHGDAQFLDYVESNIRGAKTDLVFKTNCPWRVITPPGYSVLQLPMFYHFNEDWTVLPGIIDTDIYHDIHQQILYHADGRDVRIARGTPLAMYIPYKRDKFNPSAYFMKEEEKNRFLISDLTHRNKIFSMGTYKAAQKKRDSNI